MKIADTLPRDQQKLLAAVLSDKVGGANHEPKSAAAKSPHKYNSLYQKLLETFKKAKKAVAPIAKSGVVPKMPDQPNLDFLKN